MADIIDRGLGLRSVVPRKIRCYADGPRRTLCYANRAIPLHTGLPASGSLTPPTIAVSMNNDVVLRQRQSTWNPTQGIWLGPGVHERKMWGPSNVNLAGGEYGFLDLDQ